MTMEQHILAAIGRGRNTLSMLRTEFPEFMRADIRFVLCRLVWRGQIVRRLGRGYQLADAGCPRSAA